VERHVAAGTDALATHLRGMVGDRSAPVVVGIDGRSGVGKSTLASAVSAALTGSDGERGVTVVDGDDFSLLEREVSTWCSTTPTNLLLEVVPARRSSTAPGTTSVPRYYFGGGKSATGVGEGCRIRVVSFVAR